MMPRKLEPLLFGFILSGLMSLVVSGISTFRAAGLFPGYLSLWTAAWLTAWLFAFPSVLKAAPLVRRFVGQLVERE